MSTEWNASVYHQVSAPQVSWGKKVLARTPLRGDEHVLDAGCGTGRLTRDLLEALPNGHVTGLDLSENMLRTAEQHLAPEFGSRVRFVHANLQDLVNDHPALPGAQFDVIFSTASFHWVKDHERLFAGLHRMLRPGGLLQAQCGGAGNLDHFFVEMNAIAQGDPYAKYLNDFPSPWEFASAETAAERLRRAGFVDIHTDLELAPTQFASPAEYEQFVESVVVRNHLERLPDPKLRRAFMAELTRRASEKEPALLLDYVRVNLEARRPA